MTNGHDPRQGTLYGWEQPLFKKKKQYATILTDGKIVYFCKLCGNNFPADKMGYLFRKNGSRLCDDCEKIYHRKNNSKLEAKIRRSIVQKEYRKTVKGRANILWHRAGWGAKKNDVPFTLTKEWIRERLEKNVCEVTGIPFNFNHVSSRQRVMFAPSVDRIIPENGYVETNCRLTVWCYNAGKGEGTDEEFLEMARALVEKHAC